MDKKKISMDDVPKEVQQIPSAKSTEKGNKQPDVSPVLQNLSKYHLKEDDTFIIKFGVLLFEGRWRVVDFEKLDSFPDAEKHWAKFKMLPYGLQNWIKEQSTKYDKLLRIHKFDGDLANRIKIQKLLIDWSFSDQDDKCKLHHVNGTMTDECYGLFEKMQPNIVNYIINKMNEVLDYNG